MSITMKPLDIVEILSASQELADLIISSEEMKAYQRTKRELEEDMQAQKVIADFQKLKEQYEEVQRFGRYHPDYNQVTKDVRVMKRELDMVPGIAAFKRAENAMDELLYQVSRIIADAVSDSIKVPSNNPLYNLGGGCSTSGGCGTGGACGCR